MPDLLSYWLDLAAQLRQTVEALPASLFGPLHDQTLLALLVAAWVALLIWNAVLPLVYLWRTRRP